MYIGVLSLDGNFGRISKAPQTVACPRRWRTLGHLTLSSVSLAHLGGCHNPRDQDRPPIPRSAPIERHLHGGASHGRARNDSIALFSEFPYIEGAGDSPGQVHSSFWSKVHQVNQLPHLRQGPRESPHLLHGRPSWRFLICGVSRNRPGPVGRHLRERAAVLGDQSRPESEDRVQVRVRV